MQEFTIFDMVVLGITLVLGLKGLFKGLIKEVFGIIGIIGAIFVASRISKTIGDMIAPVLAIESETSIKLIGFIASLVGFWLIVYFLGVIVSKIFSASGLGIVDRIFGFLFGAAKVFLIFSVIAYAMYQVESFRKAIDEKAAGSVVMPHLLSVGSYIIKLDTSVIADKIGKTVDTVVESTNNETTSQKIEKSIDEAKQSVQNTVTEVKNNVQEEVVKNVEEQVKETSEASQEKLDSLKEKFQSIANKPNEENN